MRWTEADKQALLRMAKTHSAAQIGQVVGRSASAVRRYASFAKISLRKLGRSHHNGKYSNEEIVTVMKLALRGYSSAEISRRTGISQGYIDGIRTGRARWRETILVEIE